MQLAAGDRLGPYEITGLLGKGGMGEVYRALDPTLHRAVAIKVLPAAFADDADYLARFQREAQALAALHHPNIATIFGLEHNAIVMELVEGDTLRAPLPLDEALNVAKQIADALEAAHDKGIIHRDLKPGNIKVTPEGGVKVLDFGLAKAVERTSSGSTSDSPTRTVRATEAGLILGTAAYMSPEQASGKPVDRRADIWSFGVILHELITGTRLFDGETVSHTLAEVIKTEIDFSGIPAGPIRDLLRRCLDRNVKSRLSYISEARIAIEQHIAHPTVPGDTRSPSRHLSWRAWFPWLIAATAVVIAVVASRTAKPVSQPLIRLAAEPGPEYSRTGAAILSPDGTRVLYTGVGADGVGRLYTRMLNQETTSALEDTEGAIFPFFSPDGESVGFFSGSKLRRVSIRGGNALVLCDAPLPQGGSWGGDGSIVAALASSGVLSRIAAGGGAPQPLTRLRQELTHRWPQVLPGSEAVLFTAHTAGLGFDDATIEVQSLRTGERKTLLRGGTYGRYAPSGHLLYVRQQVLFAAPMDLRTLRLTGPGVPVVEGVASTSYGYARFDLSSSGTLIYGKPTGAKQSLMWLDRPGKTAPLRSGVLEYGGSIEFAPDGKRLVMAMNDAGNPDVWVYDLDRDVDTRLTFTAGLDAFPRWAPDGEHILFSSVRHGGSQNLYWMRADGAGEAVRLTTSDEVHVPNSISPDGKYILFTVVNAQTGYDIWRLPIDGAGTDHPKAGKAEPFLVTPFNEGNIRISPDGRWASYESAESGQLEVFVRPFPGPGGKWRVSTGGGYQAVWSGAGRALSYLNAAGIMAAAYKADSESFAAGKPQVWAEHKALRGFAMAPDGKRAVVAVDEQSGQPAAPELVFLFGFLDDLRRRAPAGRQDGPSDLAQRP